MGAEMRPQCFLVRREIRYLKIQILPPLSQFLPVALAVLERLAAERETRNPPEVRDCG